MLSTRYANALSRNLAELQRAILDRTLLVAIEKERAAGSGFLRLAYMALFNDYVAHCIKVFEKSTRVASFWYLYRTDQHLCDAWARSQKIDVPAMDAVATKLKHIRDLTHFHIDVDAVLDAKAVWKTAGLSGKELASAVDAAWSLTTQLQKHQGLPEVTLPEDYTVRRMQREISAFKAAASKM